MTHWHDYLHSPFSYQVRMHRTSGWLHGICVGACGFVSPLCGFSLSLFCNYLTTWELLSGVTCTVRTLGAHNREVLPGMSY